MTLVHRHTHRVSYAECTLGNHVYYARYLHLLEEARGEFFRALGHPLRQLQEADTAFPVVECHLKYRAPARYDDLLTIETWVVELGRVRLTFGHRILDAQGECLFEATTMHACANTAEKMKRLPEDLRRLLEAHRPPREPSSPTANLVPSGETAAERSSKPALLAPQSRRPSSSRILEP